jgi:putative intracellular protease/amidase
MKVLIVLTSHDRLGDTGRKTGFWLEELAAPYYAFKDAGVEITLASPEGGEPPLDPKSDEASFQTEQTRRFQTDEAAKAQLASTACVPRTSPRSSTPAATARSGTSRRTGAPSP